MNGAGRPSPSARPKTRVLLLAQEPTALVRPQPRIDAAAREQTAQTVSKLFLRSQSKSSL